MIIGLFVLILKAGFSCSTAPSAPLNFSISTVNGSPEELEATWTSPDSANGVIRNYTVVCNGSVDPFVFDGSEFSVRLTDLEPFTLYECSVFATTDAGMGDASLPSAARTDEAGKIVCSQRSIPVLLITSVKKPTLQSFDTYQYVEYGL